MMDRIEHTEHKRRDREATNARFGDHRYGAAGAESEEPDTDDRPEPRT